jgi:hypothetical protein
MCLQNKAMKEAEDDDEAGDAAHTELELVATSGHY